MEGRPRKGPPNPRTVPAARAHTDAAKCGPRRPQTRPTRRRRQCEGRVQLGQTRPTRSAARAAE
eukprot:3588714-Prymnesium_polylepis.1